MFRASEPLTRCPLEMFCAIDAFHFLLFLKLEESGRETERARAWSRYIVVLLYLHEIMDWVPLPAPINPLTAVRRTTARVCARAEHVSLNSQAIERLAHVWATADQSAPCVGWNETGWHYSEDAAAGGSRTCQYVFVLGESRKPLSTLLLCAEGNPTKKAERGEPGCGGVHTTDTFAQCMVGDRLAAFRLAFCFHFAISLHLRGSTYVVIDKSTNVHSVVCFPARATGGGPPCVRAAYL